MGVYVFGDGQTFIRDMGLNDPTTRGANNEIRICNAAVSLLRAGLRDEWDRKTAKLVFSAALTLTGTMTVDAAGTVVGSGTNFTAAMVGRMLYIGGDLRPVRILTYASATSATVEAYSGPNVGLSVTGVVTDERKVLPADFRELAKVDQGSRLYRMKYEQEVSVFNELNRRIAYRGVPGWYAFEFADTSASPPVKQAFLRIYPAPVADTEIDIWYFGGPLTITGAANDSFGLPDWPESRTLIEYYLLAELRRFQGDVPGWQTNKAMGDEFARTMMARMQPSSDASQFEAYRGPGEAAFPWRAQFADGVVQA